MNTIQQLSSTIEAYHNCIKSGNAEWADNHHETIRNIEKNLPSGSGIDCGTKIDLDNSTSDKIILLVSFHHMDDNGYYDGWSEHEIIVTPAFYGIDIRITGKNRNDIKEYLTELYDYELTK
jgi:hypothetical protein